MKRDLINLLHMVFEANCNCATGCADGGGGALIAGDWSGWRVERKTARIGRGETHVPEHVPLRPSPGPVSIQAADSAFRRFLPHRRRLRFLSRHREAVDAAGWRRRWGARRVRRRPSTRRRGPWPAAGALSRRPACLPRILVFDRGARSFPLFDHF